MRRIILLLFLVCMSGSVGVTNAAAQGSAAPSGSSAVDQYRENIPGGRSDGGSGSSGSSSTSGAKAPTGAGVGSREREALESQGAEGRQLADVLGAGGGTSSSDSSTSGSSSKSGTGDAPGETDDRSGVASKGKDSSARGDGTTGEDATTADSGRSGDTTSESAVKSSLGSDFGPVPLWVMLVIVMGGALMVVALRRRA